MADPINQKITFMLLNIFNSGLLFWALTGIFVFLESIFIYQIAKGSKSGTWVNDGSGGSISSKDNKPWYKNNFMIFVVIVLIAYIGALLALASDYK
jgi:hypothetical protein